MLKEQERLEVYDEMITLAHELSDIALQVQNATTTQEKTKALGRFEYISRYSLEIKDRVAKIFDEEQLSLKL